MKTLDLNPRTGYHVDHEGDIEIDLDEHSVYLTKDDLLSMIREIKKWEENNQ